MISINRDDVIYSDILIYEREETKSATKCPSERLSEVSQCPSIFLDCVLLLSEHKYSCTSVVINKITFVCCV